MNLSKWVLIALIVLFTGLIFQKASAAPKYKSFILAWIDPEPADKMSPISYVSGRLREPCDLNNERTLEQGDIYPARELVINKQGKVVILDECYLMALFLDDIHCSDTIYSLPSIEATDLVQGVLCPHLSNTPLSVEEKIELVSFEQSSISEFSLQGFWSEERNKKLIEQHLQPPHILGYLGNTFEITTWLPTIKEWQHWVVTLHSLLWVREAEPIKAFFSSFSNLSAEEKRLVLLEPNGRGDNALQLASELHKKVVISTMIKACPVQHVIELLMAKTHDKHEWGILHIAASYQPQTEVQVICDALTEYGLLEKALKIKTKDGHYPADLGFSGDYSSEVFPLLTEKYNGPVSKLNSKRLPVFVGLINQGLIWKRRHAKKLQLQE